MKHNETVHENKILQSPLLPTDMTMLLFMILSKHHLTASDAPQRLHVLE